MKVLFTLFLLLLLSTKQSFASGFHIKSIGGVETGGRQMSRFWHTSHQPTLKGEALPGASVIITIDDQANEVNADSAGEWVFIPVTPLPDGDHLVKVVSGGSVVNMTLTIGSSNVNYTEIGETEDGTLPTVGIFWPTLILGSCGSGMMWLSGKMSRRG